MRSLPGVRAGAHAMHYPWSAWGEELSAASCNLLCMSWPLAIRNAVPRCASHGNERYLLQVGLP